MIEKINSTRLVKYLLDNYVNWSKVLNRILRDIDLWFNGDYSALEEITWPSNCFRETVSRAISLASALLVLSTICHRRLHKRQRSADFTQWVLALHLFFSVELLSQTLPYGSELFYPQFLSYFPRFFLVIVILNVCSTNELDDPKESVIYI